MKKAGFVVVAGIGIVIVSACSGGASNPQDACNQLVSATCGKIYQCVDATTIKNTLGYTSQSDCVVKLTAQYNCPNAACPQGRTFNSANATTCINDINAEACNQASSVPPSCQSTAICQ